MMNQDRSRVEIYESRKYAEFLTVLRPATLVALLIIIVVLIACRQSPDSQRESSIPLSIEQVPRITAYRLYKDMQKNEDILIIDTRGIEEYMKGHIEGAISVPSDRIAAGEWQPPEGKQLILY
jgi:hypothetical protein